VYADLEFVCQQVTGLAIAGLYHLWERLVKEFLETSFRAVDPPVTPQTVRRADFNVVVVWFRERFGWVIEAEGFFADLHQLHLVANVVKHGDGKSCEALLEKAPQLFRDFGHPWANARRGADDLRLQRGHFDQFAGSVVQFIECFPTVGRQPVASTRREEPSRTRS
jgi:hypothetical protein